MIKIKFIFSILILCNCIVFSQSKTNIPKFNPQKMVVYCIPGQGADHRLFNNFDLGENYEIRFVNFEIPHRNETMFTYANRLANQIDTSGKFILIGVSLGGMIATEMTDFLKPEKTILISSAKCRKELPGRYRFQRKIPLYKLVPKGLMKLGAKIMQPIVEPDRRKEKATFKKMLNAKDKKFMKRSVGLIINWKRESYDSNIIHIHGDNDHTIPIRNVKYDHLVKGGSHMITLTRGKEISELVMGILNKN